MPSRRFFFHATLVATVVVGAAIRLWQYALDPSLWMDEALLSLNVVARDYTQLLEPLSFNQAAPLGFLVLQRVSVGVFGNNEYALRLFPLLCGLSALPFFWLVARRGLAGLGLLTACGLFALSPQVIFHTVEAKQYAGDVLAALLAAWIGARCWERTPNLAESLGYGLLGSGLLWISHPATFALGGAACCLLASAATQRDWPRLRLLAPALALWLATVGLLFALTFHRLTHDQFLLGYWQNGFVPFPPTDAEKLRWYGDRFARFLVNPLELGPAWLSGAALLGGSVALAWLSRRLFWLLVSPLLLAAAASALHAYPLSDRLLVFLVPAALIALGAGITVLWNDRRWLLHAVAVLVAVSLVGPQVWRVAQNPARGRATHELRPVLQQVAAQRQPGDAIHLYCMAWGAFTYYAPKFGLSDAPLTVSPARESGQAALQADLKKLAGRGRVWVVFSHIAAAKTGEDDRVFSLGVLDGLGRRVQTIEADGAWAYFYEL